MDECSIRDVIEPLSHDEFGDFLSERGFHVDVISLFVDQHVSVAAFLKISEDDLKELIPIIGDRILIRELLRECQVISMLIEYTGKTQSIYVSSGTHIYTVFTRLD